MGKKRDMTPKERVMAATELREVDRVPCLPFIREYGITYYGYTFSQMYEDYRRFVDVQVNFSKKFDLDCVWDIMMTSPEAEAMGLKQTYYEDQAPNPVQSPLENSTDLSQIKMLDPSCDAKIPLLINIVRGLKERVGNELPIVAFCQAGYRNAVFLRGINNFMLDLEDRPKWLMELIELATEGCIIYGKALIEAGADIILIANPLASGSFVKRDYYEKFSLPFDKKQFDAYHEAGAKVMYHICGWWDDRWDLIVKTGADIISLDSGYVNVDFKKAVREMGNKVSLLGQVDVVQTMLEGSVEQVKKETREALDIGTKAKGFMLSGACVVPKDTPKENFRAFIDTWKDFNASRHGS
ncbi:MAG: uroporphyrinogen decarboxylase family protein [Nitrospirota bacterium]